MHWPILMSWQTPTVRRSSTVTWSRGAILYSHRSQTLSSVLSRARYRRGILDRRMASNPPRTKSLNNSLKNWSDLVVPQTQRQLKGQYRKLTDKTATTEHRSSSPKMGSLPGLDSTKHRSICISQHPQRRSYLCFAPSEFEAMPDGLAGLKGFRVPVTSTYSIKLASFSKNRTALRKMGQRDGDQISW